MKKLIISILSFVVILSMFGCSQNHETTVLNTYEKTDLNLIKEYIENSKEVISTTYYEMSDGTWKTAELTYKYKLVTKGRLNNATKDVTYTILSNIENITFEQAWKASGISSNSDDYFQAEDAVIVATKIE